MQHDEDMAHRHDDLDRHVMHHPHHDDPHVHHDHQHVHVHDHPHLLDDEADSSMPHAPQPLRTQDAMMVMMNPTEPEVEQTHVPPPNQTHESHERELEEEEEKGGDEQQLQ